MIINVYLYLTEADPLRLGESIHQTAELKQDCSGQLVQILTGRHVS